MPDMPNDRFWTRLAFAYRGRLDLREGSNLPLPRLPSVLRKALLLTVPDDTSALSSNLIERASRLSSATMHEAGGKIGALPSVLKATSSLVRLTGRAFPVKCPPGDNLWLHRAIYAAAPGDVLVVDVGGAVEHGYWGEVMALAAQQRGIAGLVIAGGVRDSVRMLEMGFPVFSAAICIRGTGKDPFGAGALGETISFGDVSVHLGDLVFGDADGVIIVPAARAEEIVECSEKRDAAEQAIFEELRAGKSTIEIYHLPTGRDA